MQSNKQIEQKNSCKGNKKQNPELVGYHFSDLSIVQRPHFKQEKAFKTHNNHQIATNAQSGRRRKVAEAFFNLFIKYICCPFSLCRGNLQRFAEGKSWDILQAFERLMGKKKEYLQNKQRSSLPVGWSLPGSPPVSPSWCKIFRLRFGHMQRYRRCSLQRHGAAFLSRCHCRRDFERRSKDPRTAGI